MVNVRSISVLIVFVCTSLWSSNENDQSQKEKSFGEVSQSERISLDCNKRLDVFITKLDKILSSHSTKVVDQRFITPGRVFCVLGVVVVVGAVVCVAFCAIAQAYVNLKNENALLAHENIGLRTSIKDKINMLEFLMPSRQGENESKGWWSAFWQIFDFGLEIGSRVPKVLNVATEWENYFKRKPSIQPHLPRGGAIYPAVYNITLPAQQQQKNTTGFWNKAYEKAGELLGGITVSWANSLWPSVVKTS